jgi:hypothetical protein
MALDIEVRRSNIRQQRRKSARSCSFCLVPSSWHLYLDLSLERKLVGVTASPSFDTFQLKSFNRTRVNRNVIEFCSD